MRILFGVAVLFVSLLANAQAPDYPTASPPRTIVKAEYFFDTDPGFGNGTPISLTAAADIANFSTVINLNGSALTNGFHRLYLRTQDDAGRWSLVHNALFDNVNVPTYPAAPGAAGVITDVEYFIDTDPGFGQGTKITVPATGDVSSMNALIDLSSLSSGVHRLYIRSKDASGKWSLTNFAIFDNAAQTPYPAAPAPAAAITQAEYYFDTDPGFGNGTPITVPSSTDIANFSFDVSVASLSQGRHILYLRSKENPWSMSAYAEFLFGSTLPVSFLYARAQAVSNDAVITWATGFEQNAQEFVIEYSRNGQSFTAVGSVPAENRATGSSYSYRHIQPAAGAAYYRIKQVDKDGKATYSKLLLVLMKKDLQQPYAFPNPAKTEVNIAMPVTADYNRIDIIAGDGRLIKTIAIQKGQQAMTISVNDLQKGNYFLLFQGNSGKLTLPLVKQ